MRQSKEPPSSSSGEHTNGRRPFQPSRHMPPSATSASRPSAHTASCPSLLVASCPSRSSPSASNLSRPLPAKAVERAFLANPTHPARVSRDPIGARSEEEPFCAERHEPSALEQNAESGKLQLKAVKHDKWLLQEDLAKVRAQHSLDAEKWAKEMKDMEIRVAQLSAKKNHSASGVGESIRDYQRELWEKEALVKETQLALAKVKSDAAFARAHHVSNEALVSELLQQKLELTEELAEVGTCGMETDQAIQLHSADGEEFKRQKCEIAALREELDFHEASLVQADLNDAGKGRHGWSEYLALRDELKSQKLKLHANSEKEHDIELKRYQSEVLEMQELLQMHKVDDEEKVECQKAAERHLVTAHEELEELQKAMNATKQNLDSCETHNFVLAHNNAELTSELEEGRARLQRLENDSEETQSRTKMELQKLKSEKWKVEQKLRDKGREVDDARTESKLTLARTVEDIEQQRAKDRKAYDVLRAQRDKHESEIAGMRHQVDRMQKKLKTQGEQYADKVAVAERHFNDEITTRSSIYQAELSSAKEQLTHAKVRTHAELGQTLDALVVVEREKDRIAARLKELELTVVSEVMEREEAERQLASEHAGEVAALRTAFEDSGKELECRAAEAQEAVEKEYARAHAVWQDEVASLTTKLNDATTSHANEMLEIERARASTTAHSEGLAAQISRCEKELATAHANHEVSEVALSVAEHSIASETQAAHEHASRASQLELDMEVTGRFASELRDARSALQGKLEECEEKHQNGMGALEEAHAKSLDAHAARIRILEVECVDREERANTVDEQCAYLDARILNQKEFIAQLEEDKTRLHKQLVVLEDSKARLWTEVEQNESEWRRDAASYMKQITSLEETIAAENENQAELVAAEVAATLQEEKTKMESQWATQESLRKSELTATIEMERHDLSTRLNTELHCMIAAEKEQMEVSLAAEKEKLTKDLRAELEREKEKMETNMAEEKEKALAEMNETVAAEKQAWEKVAALREERVRMSAEKQNTIRKECELLQKRNLEEALAETEEKERKLKALRVEEECKSRTIERLEKELDDAKLIKTMQLQRERNHLENDEYQLALKERNKLKKEKWRLEQKVRSLSQSAQDLQEEHKIALVSMHEDGEARKKRDLKAIEQLRASKDDLVNERSNLKSQMAKLQSRVKHVETKFAESETDSQRKLEEQSASSHSELRARKQKSDKELQMLRDQMLEIQSAAVQEKMELKMEHKAAEALTTLEMTTQIAEITEHHAAELAVMSHQHELKCADERDKVDTCWQTEYATMRAELNAENESLAALHRSRMEKHSAELELFKEALKSEHERLGSTCQVPSEEEDDDDAAQFPESSATINGSLATIQTHGVIGKRLRALLRRNHEMQESAQHCEQGMQLAREEMHAQQKKSEMLSGELARMKEEREQYVENAEQLREATKNEGKLQRKMTALKTQMKENTLALRTETRDKIRVLESEKRRVEQNMSILKAEAERVEKEKNCELERLETAISEQQQRYEETDAVKQKKVEVLEKRNAALDDELRNVRDRVQQLEFECDAREHQLAVCASVREEREKQIIIAAAQHEEHKKQLAEAATQLQSLLADDLQRSELQQDLSSMSANFDVLRDKYETQSAQLQAAECKMAGNGDEQAKLEAHFASLNDELRDSVATVEQKRTQFGEELQDYKRQARAKETRMEQKLKNHEKEASNRIEATEAKNAQLGRVLGEIQEEVERRDRAEKNATASLRESQRVHEEYQRRHSATLAALRSELDVRKSAYAQLLEEQRAQQQQNHASTVEHAAGGKAEPPTKKNAKRGGDGDDSATSTPWNDSPPRVESDDSGADAQKTPEKPLVQEEVESDLGNINNALSELKQTLDTKKREIDERRSTVVRSDDELASYDPVDLRVTHDASAFNQRPRIFMDDATGESSNSTARSSDESVAPHQTTEMALEQLTVNDLVHDDVANAAGPENGASFALLQQQYDARLNSMGSDDIDPTMSERDFLASASTDPMRHSAYPESPRLDAWGVAFSEKKRASTSPADDARLSGPPRVVEMKSEDEVTAMFREGERLCCEESAFEKSLAIFDNVLDYFASPNATHAEISHAEVWAHKGVALQSLDRVEPAIEAYSAAITLDPKMHVCLANLATLAAYLRRDEMARQMITDALSLDPGNETYMEIRRALGATRNYYQD